MRDFLAVSSAGDAAERDLPIDSDGFYFDEKSGNKSINPFVLGVIEEQDLPDVSRFVVESFGADAIRLSSDLASLERALMAPAVELLNSYSGLVAFAEVLQGLRSRTDYNFAVRRRDQYLDCPPIHRFAGPGGIAELAGRSSVVLALARSNAKHNDRLDVIACVELRLQPCDAKIPFTLPWLDNLERRLGSVVGLSSGSYQELQPYLSNLCVCECARGQGIGRALVRAVEHLSRCWAYSRIYLHVDSDNLPAYNLYCSEGYRDVGRRWNPFWAGGSASICYFVKDI
jgi:ribosomal protein S18 acetylase RimI-like enzyme